MGKPNTARWYEATHSLPSGHVDATDVVYGDLIDLPVRNGIVSITYKLCEVGKIMETDGRFRELVDVTKIDGWEPVE